jgi:hypothetical protein
MFWVWALFPRGLNKRGRSNKLLFDPNCVVIFGEIKKLKSKEKSAKEITSLITEEYSSAKKISYAEMPADQTVQTREQILQIKELYQMLLAEKDRLIQEMDKRDLRIARLEIVKVKSFESHLKFLPNCRKPAKVTSECYGHDYLSTISSFLRHLVKSFSQPVLFQAPLMFFPLFIFFFKKQLKIRWFSLPALQTSFKSLLRLSFGKLSW